MTIINSDEFSINLDKYYSPSMLETIERGLSDIREGKTRRYTIEELQLKMGL
ncbi:MAG: hypothetical protein FWH18_07195 [Marinilabiliaceae bacterium]|nr:hypothetical protein [Marinilabiliaceae bacterium]